MSTITPPEIATRTAGDARPSERSERVLVIDDEEEIRSTLAEFIALNGFQVETAGDGRRALEMLEHGTYDVVLCDLQMPGANGLVVVDAARATHPDLPVIVITGHASIESAVHALRAGAYDYLRKPFTLDEIQRTIANCLEKRQLRRHNAELAATNERLREIERIKDDLLSTVSHEFRTPLAVMAGFLSIIEARGTANLRPEQAEALEAIRANVGRLDAMIGNLLTLVEVHDGGYRAVRERVRAGDFLEGFLGRSERIRQGGDFRAEIEEDAAEATVLLDRARFPLVLDNLLDNAFKFARGAGPARVELRASRADGELRLDVHDDGVGISPALGERAFDRFTQGDMTSTRVFSGVGLGLAVVREIVRAHEGTVTLERPVLGGASVRVAVPIVPPSAGSAS